MTNRNDLVAVARGDKAADLLIQNVKMVNVFTLTLDTVDIGIYGDRIAYVLAATNTKLTAHRTIDGSVLYAAPGFIDGHVHNESSRCTPRQYAKTIVPRGTTAVCTDPHEIGNVMGLRGIEYMIAASRGIPLHYFITASSCVPAVPSVETAGAEFRAPEMETLLGMERVIAVAEAMDYMGLIHQTGNITPIVEVGHRYSVPIEGHAPGVIDRLLQAYLAAAGPRASDHESWGTDEMLEKARSGMMVYARYSTFINTLEALAGALEQVNDCRMFGFCTDDIFPEDLQQYGHLDRGMRALIALGINPLVVYQMATKNVAAHYGLDDIGAIAPSMKADIVLLSNLEEVSVQHVIFEGEVVVYDGQWQVDFNEPIEPLLENTVHIPDLTEEDFLLRVPYESGTVTINVINMSELLTTHEVLDVEVENGVIQLAPGQAFATIVPRHGQGTNPSIALLNGYGLQRGAIASTISHDSHNMVIFYTNPADALFAAEQLREIGGGVIAVLDGKVLAVQPLPIAGLMSPLSVAELSEQSHALHAVMPLLGLQDAFPVGLIALGLPVFPFLRLTDKGMVDVATQQFVPLLA